MIMHKDSINAHVANSCSYGGIVLNEATISLSKPPRPIIAKMGSERKIRFF